MYIGGMENTSLYEVVESLLVLFLVVRLLVVNIRLRRENRELRDRLSRIPDKSVDEFWKKYRDTAPKT